MVFVSVDSSRRYGSQYDGSSQQQRAPQPPYQHEYHKSPYQEYHGHDRYPEEDEEMNSKMRQAAIHEPYQQPRSVPSKQQQWYCQAFAFGICNTR